MTPLPLPSWSDLVLELEDALLALPGDGLLELLVRDLALTVSWLLPDRLLLELSGAPPAAVPALHARGWSGTAARHTTARGQDRARAAAAAACEAVVVLRHVLSVEPGDVELWRPRTGPPEPCHAPPRPPGSPW